MMTKGANEMTLTDASKALFIEYAKDAGNWSGNPLVGGNVKQTQEHNGNLTHLKKAGLLTTFRDEGCTWIQFTETGVAFAAELGIKIS
jgi:hypothetical protein